MSNNRYKILVVEDDRSILSMIQTVLDSNGYQVLTAQRCQQGILMLSSHVPDLVVLDLGLPDMDGEEFIRITRRSSIIPIIVLSARTDEKDKVSALDLGANDYITKPFGTAELLARVRASLRINRMNLQASLPSSIFTLDDLEIDYDRRQVSVDGKIVHMTQIEYNILSLLSQQVGKVMTYSAIAQPFSYDTIILRIPVDCKCGFKQLHTAGSDFNCAGYPITEENFVSIYKVLEVM